MPSGARRPRRPPGEPIHRLRPVVWATFGVLATYAGLQVLAGRTMTSTLWWQNEWLRIKLAHKYPKSSFAHAVPGPGWQTWLPSAATSFVLVLALVLLALLAVLAVVWTGVLYTWRWFARHASRMGAAPDAPSITRTGRHVLGPSAG